MRSKLDRVCEQLRIKAVCEYGANKAPGFPGAEHSWRVTLKNGRRRLSVDFFQGAAHHSEPTPADVLSCLMSDASAGSLDFADFCAEYGYDLAPDYRRGVSAADKIRTAQRIHAACVALGPKLRRFLGADFDTIANAEH